MWVVIAFSSWLVVCCGTALVIGGRTERIAAALLTAAFAASLLASHLHSSRQYALVYLDTWLIDLALLAGLYVLAIRSTRYWPMWIVAIHLNAVFAHPLRLLNSKMMPESYYGFVNFAAWPMLTILAIGAIRHYGRVNRFGSDPSFPTS